MRHPLPLRGLRTAALPTSAPARRAARAVLATAVATGLLAGTVPPALAASVPTTVGSSIAATAAPTVLAADSFGRTVTGGWGTATVGGQWTTSSGSTYTVGSGAGRHVVPSGKTAVSALNGVSSTATDVRVDVAMNRKAGAGPVAYASVLGRSVPGAADYRARLAVTAGGALELQVALGSTVLKKVALTDLAYASGSRVSVRVEVSGVAPTTVRAKAWKAGTTEPTAWRVSATDSTAALQSAGRVVLSTYVSTSPTALTAAYYGLEVADVTPTNVLPTAAFTATASGLGVALDGSASKDADGTIASYVWTHGDGTTSTGAKVSKKYTAAGTYQSALTVTDDRGGKATSARTVTVTAPVPTTSTVTVQPAPTAVRKAALHPFASTSVWNTAIGSGAKFESRTGVKTASFLTAKPVINSSVWSTPVYQAKTTDVLATLKSVRTGQSWKIRIPSNANGALGSGGYTDGHATIIQPDGRTAYDTYKLVKRSSTLWEAQVAKVTDLHAAGTHLGVRAAGTPGMAGLIRSHELRERKINHALAVAVPDSVLKSGFVWPAKSQDSNGGTAYKGQVPMGTLLAIPGSVDLTTLGLSPEGLALAKALQNYGAYVVDRAGMAALYCETSCEATATSRMATDWRKLQGQMRAVTNSAATTVGGGGTPRLATLPALS